MREQRERRYRGDRDGRGGRGRKKKVCRFCTQRGAAVIDYKNIQLLGSFIDERGRIKKARQTGTCRRHQSRMAQAIKRAREMALLPYTTD